MNTSLEQTCKQLTLCSKEDILTAMQITSEIAEQAEMAANQSILLRLATEEACTNAWEHCVDKGHGPCEIQWFLDDSDLEISLFQASCRFDPPEPEPDRRGSRGRGLVLIYGIMDEVKLIHGPSYTALWMRKGRESGDAEHG